mgnify:CR=1 FL=1|tara:strand:- start:4867 stop:5619 length:753 start_codon:yes stop_codon:yes gene_type:complete
MHFDGLRGRSALVTGASGTIGGAIAKSLAEHGVKVVVHYRHNLDSAQSLVDEIDGNGGHSGLVQGDISTVNGATDVVEQAMGFSGGLDILVNNAGITKDGLLARMSETDWDSVIDTNLKSTYMVSRAVLRPMLKARFGRIINISSVSGLMGNAGQVNYSAAKAGIIGFTKALAREVASRGVTVNAVAPGFIDSPMARDVGDNVMQKILETIPIGRLGSPEEIAGWVSMLASESGEYVTGQVVVVDGGLSM